MGWHIDAMEYYAGGKKNSEVPYVLTWKDLGEDCQVKKARRKTGLLHATFV
jgi:hypothetical protein